MVCHLLPFAKIGQNRVCMNCECITKLPYCVLAVAWALDVSSLGLSLGKVGSSLQGLGPDGWVLVYNAVWHQHTSVMFWDHSVSLWTVLVSRFLAARCSTCPLKEPVGPRSSGRAWASMTSHWFSGSVPRASRIASDVLPWTAWCCGWLHQPAKEQEQHGLKLWKLRVIKVYNTTCRNLQSFGTPWA